MSCVEFCLTEFVFIILTSYKNKRYKYRDNSKRVSFPLQANCHNIMLIKKLSKANSSVKHQT